MSEMTTPFIVYWQKLKENDPDEYQAKLKRNRERIQKQREALYANPEKHEIYKQKQRDKYKQKQRDTQLEKRLHLNLKNLNN